MSSFNEWLSQRDNTFNENENVTSILPKEEFPRTRNYSKIAGLNTLMDALYALSIELTNTAKFTGKIHPKTADFFYQEADRYWRLIKEIENERLGEAAVQDLVHEIEHDLVKYGLKKKPGGEFVDQYRHYHNYLGKNSHPDVFRNTFPRK